MVGAVSQARSISIAVALDVALVTAFVLIGRGSHGSGPALLAFAGTLWPFLTALALGWLVSFAWRRPDGLLLPGLVVWGITVGGGMLLRSLAGGGVQPSFVIVTALVLAVFLLGWRGIARLLRLRQGAVEAARRAHHA